ncbi:MAG: undecaprenyl-diphosphatase UppP [Candidatus Omnitrophica bacterium]|nr:undecaprenyl-diphosphatase UppP [Candidatus Omnitrophota bacterium]
MNLWQVIILGLVEGITEFLPISSTGHMMLTASLLKIPTTEFLKTFEIFIQLGAICSVIVLYWRVLTARRELIKKIVAAFIPTAVIGLFLYKIVKKYLLQSPAVVPWALLIGGIVIILFERYYGKKSGPAVPPPEISYRQAVLIGLFQAIAVIPGVSRSAATIIGGLAVGINRHAIVEFSFLLAIPTMLAAAVLDLVKTAGTFSRSEIMQLVVGFFVAFVTAIGAIKFLLAYIKTNNFIPFGIYRIIAALLFLLWMAG